MLALIFLVSLTSLVSSWELDEFFYENKTIERFDPCGEDIKNNLSRKDCAIFLPAALYFEKERNFAMNNTQNVSMCVFMDYSNMIFYDLIDLVLDYKKENETDKRNFSLKFCQGKSLSNSIYFEDNEGKNLNATDITFQHRFVPAKNKKNYFFMLNESINEIDAGETQRIERITNIEIFFSDQKEDLKFKPTEENLTKSQNETIVFHIEDYKININMYTNSNLTAKLTDRIFTFPVTLTINRYCHYFSCFLLFFSCFTILYGKRNKSIVYFLNGPTIITLIGTETQWIIPYVTYRNLDDLGLMIVFVTVCFGFFLGLFVSKSKILEKIELSFFVAYTIYYIFFSIFLKETHIKNGSYYKLSHFIQFVIIIPFCVLFCIFYQEQKKIITDLLIIYQGCFGMIMTMNLIAGGLPFFPVLALVKNYAEDDKYENLTPIRSLFSKMADEVYEVIFVLAITFMILFVVGLFLSSLLSEDDDENKDKIEYRNSEMSEKEPEEDGFLDSDDSMEKKKNKEVVDDTPDVPETPVDQRAADMNNTSGRLSDYSGLCD